jgi:hypothetical protein
MKLIALFSLMTLSTFASADVLVKYTSGSGFSPVPSSVSVEISDNGKVVATTFKGQSKEKSTIATLSATAVQSLKDKIESFEDNSKLIDLDAKKPRCMDAPSSTVSINKGGKSIDISARSACHTFKVENAYTDNLTNLIQSLGTLK